MTFVFAKPWLGEHRGKCLGIMNEGLWERAPQNKLQQIWGHHSSPGYFLWWRWSWSILAKFRCVPAASCPSSTSLQVCLYHPVPGWYFRTNPSQQGWIMTWIIWSISTLLICSWRAREMGGNHKVAAGTVEIQLPEAKLARANPYSMADYKTQ